MVLMQKERRKENVSVNHTHWEEGREEMRSAELSDPGRWRYSLTVETELLVPTCRQLHVNAGDGS